MDLLMDLGTANFRAAISGGNDLISEPSFVARDTADKIIIGAEALQMVGRNPDFVEITAPIEGGVIRDIQAVVQIIQHCVKHFMPHGFARKYNLTIAIPSGLTQVEQRAVEESGKMAGARNVKLVDASVAAALGAGLPIQQPTGCLVVNLGAGVTEATALSMNGVVGSGRLGVGGRDIDKAIIERIRKKYSLLLGLRSAEELKRRFGESRESVTELEVRGRSLRTGLPESIMVSRMVINEQFSQYCETIVDLIIQTMSTCPPEIAGDITERGIVLVGGGAMTTGLKEELMVRIDVPVIVAEEPDSAVILGLSQMGNGKNTKYKDRALGLPGRRGFGLNRITSGLKKVAGGDTKIENRHEE